MFAKRRVGDQPHPRAGVLLVVAASMAVSAPAFSFDPGTGADAYRYLSAYASLGPHHRAGTTANEDTVNWLESELQSIGLATGVQSFEFQRYLPQTASLSVGSFSPEVFPLYYSGRTGSSQEIQAPLVDAGLGTALDFALHPAAGKIALVEIPMPLPGLAATLGNAISSARMAGAVAMVASIEGPLNEISSPDVDERTGLCGFPVLIIGKVDGSALRQHAGEMASFVLNADYGTATSWNVVGILPSAGDDVIVIGTPITGWFTAAAERGAGVGAMLTLARHFAAKAQSQPLPQTLLFLGTSGREIGFLGLEKFLQGNASLIPKITAYLHFGAGLAAKKYLEVGNQILELGTVDEERFITVSENPLLFGFTWSQALGNGVLPALPAPQGVATAGEEVSMYLAGVPVAAIKDTFLWIHTPGDLPYATSPELLDPVVRMYRGIVENLLGTDPATVRQANALAGLLATLPVPALPVGLVRCAS